MTRVVNVRSWSLEQILPYADQITALWRKLENRFPVDLTVASLFAEAARGEKDLWLILDGDTLKAVAMTRISTLKASGARVLTMMDLAGDGLDWAQALEDAMSAYGDEQNVDFLAVEGRSGWARVIEKFGYTESARLWRRPAKKDAA